MKKQPSRLSISLILLLGVTLACNLTSGDSGAEPPSVPAATQSATQVLSASSATPVQEVNPDPSATPIASPTRAATPKPTDTPVTQSGAPKVSNNGGFGDCPDNLTCDSSFSSETLSSVSAHFTYSDKDGDGVANVVFSIWDSNESVKFYEKTEVNPLYCTFGGDGPCNAWTFENGAFRWYSGGPAVEPGDYVIIITINGTTPDENGNTEGQMRHFFSISAP